jgi:hypothetical protein
MERTYERYGDRVVMKGLTSGGSAPVTDRKKHLPDATDASVACGVISLYQDLDEKASPDAFRRVYRAVRVIDSWLDSLEIDDTWPHPLR